MCILFFCIVIASVVQWSALCLTHWRPRLNFCGKHNIFNFKRNAIMSIALIYNLRHNWNTNLSGKWGVTLSFFIGCDEINIRGNTVDIYQIKHRGWHCCFSLVVMKKNTRDNTVAFIKWNMRGNTVVFIKWNIGGTVTLSFLSNEKLGFLWSSWKKTYNLMYNHRQIQFTNLSG